MPFTVWATGTTVTAADFNTFLQQQVLTTWADLSALNAGIASPVEGMFAFTRDNDTLYYRSSSAWVATSLTADITSVVAGTALSGGGTSGDVTVNVDVNSASTVTATSSDYILISDVTDNSTKKALISDVVATGDITAVVTATNSSMAGGASSGDADISVSVNNSTTVTAASDDHVLISDTSASNGTRKALISDITALVPAHDVSSATSIIATQVFS
jgi:hypothetical protein